MEIAEIVLEYIRTLVWPVVVVGLSLVFRRQLIALLNRIRHAELPGGVAVDLDEGIKEAKALAAKVKKEPPPPEAKDRPTIPLTGANTRLLQLGLQPSPSGLDMSYYRGLAVQDPNVALAGLRMEIDILARNLATGFDVPIDRRDTGTRLLRKLHDAGAINEDTMLLTMRVVSICNAAVHGTSVSFEEASDVIGTAEVLATQYIEWLSWGFDDDWKPRANQDENAGS